MAETQGSIVDRTAAVLFSGGPGSALAAVRTGRRFARVRLLAFTGRGWTGPKRVEAAHHRLGQFFNDPDKFTLTFLPVDPLARDLCRRDRFRRLREHGLLALSLAGPQQVAMHARALAYCLDEGIRDAAHGGTRQGPPGPGHGEAVALGRLRGIYGAVGVDLQAPAWEDGHEAESLLYDLRFTRKAKVRGTAHDQSLAFAAGALDDIVRDLLSGLPAGELERRMAAFYEPLLDRVEAWAREHAGAGRGSSLAALLA